MTPCLLLAAAAATSMFLGCGGSSPEHAAISEASDQLHALGVSGSEPLPAVADRKARYERVVKSLTPIANSGTSAEAAAASGLISRAQASLGEIAAREAADLDQDALGRITGIRSAFEQWQSQKAIADALKGYDPTPELAKLDETIREREADAARAAEAKQKQVALVAQTRAQAAEARAQAENYRNQETSIRASVANSSQTARAAAYEQALTIKRQGDEYEKQAAGFEAVAASQAPEVETLQNTIDKLNRQVQLLRDAKQSLVARADANKAQAAAAASEADQVAVKVTDLLKDLDEARGKVAAPTDEAVRLYSAAVSAAKKSSPTAPASANSRGTASVAAGNAQQSLADVLASRARGLGVYSALIGTLSAGGQPGVTAEMLSTARQAHGEAVKSAEEAYRSAIDLFKSAGGGGETKDKIDRLNEAMNKLVGEQPALLADAPPATDDMGGDKPPVEKPAEGAAADAGEFDAAAVQTEVKAALTAMKADVDAKVSASEISAKWVKADDPTAKEFMDLVMGMTAKKKALDDACVAKFGKALDPLVAESKSASVRANPMLGMLGQMTGTMSSQFDGLDPATAEVSAISATEATVSASDAPAPVKMVKVDGQWKIEGDSMLGGEQGKQVLAMSKGPLTAFGTVFEKVSGKIDADGYSDAETMLLDLSKELMAAMQKLAPGMPGGKPPGGG